jgi:endonuclease III
MVNIQKVFQVFRKNYVTVPLEVFGSDPYKTLLSTLLSARTNDDTTLKVCKEKLFVKAPTIENLNKLSQLEIEKLIYPVGFYKTKAKHIKMLTKKLLTEFKGKIPDTREELVSLPGVGRKTANLVLNRAFGVPAIAVDTHVHRISNILGWVKTKTPQETERELNKIIPENMWSDMNKLFVSIGRQYRSQRKLEEFLKMNELV